MMGRKSKSFTEEELRLISTLAGAGVTQEDIASILDVSPKTLRKHAYSAYRKGKAHANAMVGKACYDMAASGKYPEMTKFYLKMQAAWRTPMQPEVQAILNQITKNLEMDHAGV